MSRLKQKLSCWFYLGYNKEILKKYETQVARDNLQTLGKVLPIATVITLAEIAFTCFFAYSDAGVTESLYITMHILIGTAIAIVGMCVLYMLVRNKTNVTRYSRILTTILLSLWSLLYIVLGTSINPEDYAVLACGLFLIVQVMFNAYPKDNLIFVGCTYSVFVLMSFLQKSTMVFVYDMLDSFPFLLIGLFLSWIKSRSKWASLINADALVQLRTQQLENELLHSQMAVMLSQIQPHFLFNALTVIKALCRTDPEQTERATDSFSSYLRGNLDSLGAKHPIPFSRELEHTKNFMKLEKLQHGDRLTIVYDIRADAFLLPTLTLQPLAENAVKYSFRKKENVTVKVSSFEDQDGYYVTIEDNGEGFDPNQAEDKTKSHIGISNVRNRLKIQSGSRLDIRSVIGEGTRVTITVPKEKVE